MHTKPRFQPMLYTSKTEKLKISIVAKFSKSQDIVDHCILVYDFPRLREFRNDRAKSWKILKILKVLKIVPNFFLGVLGYFEP